jgi:hypothetical protein
MCNDIYWKYKIMNKSFSKIRHIQEVNQRLEKRLMSEQTQTTVVQTGENPGVKTKTTPPMSNPTLPIPTDEKPFSQEKLESFKGNTVNLYTDPENRKFKRQIRIDHINSGWSYSVNKLGKLEIAYEYEEVKDDDGDTLQRYGTATYWLNYSCDKPDQLIDFDSKLFGSPGRVLYSKFFTDKLKKEFCTVGSGGASVPKATFASTGKPQPSNLA